MSVNQSTDANEVQMDQEKIMKEYAKNKKEAEETLKDEKKTEEKLNEGVNKLNDVSKKSNIISKLFEDLKLLFEVVGAWIKGTYKEIPYATIVAIFGALLYFISPIDVIPDFIPVIGYIDDAFVIGLTIKAVSHDLENYKEWKLAQA